MYYITARNQKKQQSLTTLRLRKTTTESALGAILSELN